MESITIYPKNEKQRSLLKSLLEEMKVRFEVSETDETLMSEEEFYAKIDRSIREAEEGKVTRIEKENLRSFLGL